MATKPRKQVEQQMKVLDRAFMITFTTISEGKDVFNHLEKMFMPDTTTTKDPHTTAIRSAQSDVIRYIQRRVEDGLEG